MKKIVVSKTSFALVDDEDYADLSKFTWYRHTNSRSDTVYACRRWGVRGLEQREFMHTRITHFIKTDHINGDGLDNRRSNLREANNSQNGANRKKFDGNFSSSFKGVSWQKQRKKWIAFIRVNKQGKTLGRFDSEIEAAKAYDIAARYYFGAFARCNFEE